MDLVAVLGAVDAMEDTANERTWGTGVDEVAVEESSIAGWTGV